MTSHVFAARTVLLASWVLEHSSAAATQPLGQADLEWLQVHTWNLSKRCEALGLPQQASMLHRSVGVIVSAMSEPSTQSLRQGQYGFLGACGHVISVAEQVCVHCLIGRAQ